MKKAIFLFIALELISTGIYLLVLSFYIISQYYHSSVSETSRRYLLDNILILGASIKCYSGVGNDYAETNCLQNACQKNTIGGKIIRSCSTTSLEYGCKELGNSILCNCDKDLCNAGRKQKTSALAQLSFAILPIYAIPNILKMIFV